jgi:hypothetical protein
MKRYIWLLSVLFLIFLFFVSGCSVIRRTAKHYNRKGEEINEEIFTVIFPE